MNRGIIAGLVIVVIIIVAGSIWKSKRSSRPFRFYSGYDSSGNYFGDAVHADLLVGGPKESLSVCAKDASCVGISYIPADSPQRGGPPGKCRLKNKVVYPMLPWTPFGGMYIKASADGTANPLWGTGVEA